MKRPSWSPAASAPAADPPPAQTPLALRPRPRTPPPRRPTLIDPPRQRGFPGRGEPLRRRHEGRGAAGEARRDLDGAADSDGPYKRRTGVRTEKQGGYDVVFVTAEFERSTVDFKVVVDDRRQDRRVLHRPAPAAPGAGRCRSTPARRLCPQGCVPRARGDRAAPANGPLPGDPLGAGGPGPFPAVVLVHGSGPERPRRDGGGRTSPSATSPGGSPRAASPSSATRSAPGSTAPSSPR